MDENLKKNNSVCPKVQKKDIVMNVIYNILYALLWPYLIALIPMLDVLFKDAEKIVEEPKLTSIWEITSYGNDYLYFYITKLTNESGAQYALLLGSFYYNLNIFTENIFNYLALNHLMLLKNGVLRDLRNKMFDKIISLPISYYSEKEKEIWWQECLVMLMKLEIPFNILELVIKDFYDNCIYYWSHDCY